MRINIESITVEGKELWQVEIFVRGRKEPSDRLEIDTELLLIAANGKTKILQHPGEISFLSSGIVQLFSICDHPFVITGKEREE